MRRRAFVALLGVVLLAGSLGWSALVKAPDAEPGAEPVVFRVKSGEGLASVAARMEGEGLVVSARRFRILARLMGADRAVHAGTYSLARGEDPRALLRELAEGNVRLRRFTIPEGRRLADLAADAEATLGIPAAELLAAAADPEMRERVGARTESLEGYLFPETYLFPDDATAADVVEAATRRFLEVWKSLKGRPAPGMDRHDVVTLASIVEAETPLAEEKPRVAAVYLNRLERGMRLQADPTVRYGLGRFEGRLYYKHLDIDTPYNTYRIAGLPPGPIGAPGRAALQAVLRPLEPCEDFYFVASGDGGHVFSRTKAEHDRAVAAARSRRDAAGSR